MNDEKVFVGNTPARSRTYLRQALSGLNEQNRKLIIPCCGQFAIAKVAVASGWKPEQIRASDVSLFTTLLGSYIVGEPVPNMYVNGECISDYPEAFYQIKFITLKVKTRHYYQELLLKDLIERKEVHLQAIRDSLEDFLTLRGLTYYVRDMFEELNSMLDTNNVIWINPPGYFRGYVKHFDFGGMIQWDEPPYQEFRPNEHHNLIRELVKGKRAIVLWYRYKSIEAEDNQFAVFCEHKGRGRWDYTLCNQPELLRRGISGRSLIRRPRHFKILTADWDITENSQIGFKPIDEDTALYYRDLFIHRLGVTVAQKYYLLIIDGYIGGVVGLMSKQAYGIQRLRPFAGDVEEAFGITVHSEKHPRLNWLLMMLIKSDEFLRNHDTFAFRATGIGTTCLSQYPELKINRGIYKLIDRNVKNRVFHLRYRGDRTNQTYQQVLKEWLTKYN